MLTPIHLQTLKICITPEINRKAQKWENNHIIV